MGKIIFGIIIFSVIFLMGCTSIGEAANQNEPIRLLENSVNNTPPLPINPPGNETNDPICDQQEPKCKTFSDSFTVTVNPFNQSPEWWAEQYARVEAIKERLMAQAKAWVGGQTCPPACPKEEETYSEFTDISVKEPETECDHTKEDFDLRFTGLNCIGNCALAKRDAVVQSLDLFKTFDEMCKANGCSLSLQITNSSLTGCWESNATLFCWDPTNAQFQIAGSVECMGKSKKTEYVFQVSVEGCKKCRGSGAGVPE